MMRAAGITMKLPLFISTLIGVFAFDGSVGIITSPYFSLQISKECFVINRNACISFILLKNSLRASVHSVSGNTNVFPTKGSGTTFQGLLDVLIIFFFFFSY